MYLQYLPSNTVMECTLLKFRSGLKLTSHVVRMFYLLQ
jgi:hypothetical protein